MFGISCRLVFALTVTLGLVSADLCANLDSEFFCVCQSNNLVGPGIQMTCTGLTGSEQVLAAVRRTTDVVSLRLVNCELPSLPLGLNPNAISSLEIINSTMPYISSPQTAESAFDGLTNLTRIIVKGVRDLSNWNWSKLVPLKNLKELHIENSRLPVLPSSLSQIAGTQFWSLKLINTQTRTISPSALGSAKLQVFASHGNHLSSIRTAMFQPGKALTQLELVDTRITSLGARELAELTKLNTFITDAHMLPYLGNNPFYIPLHSVTILGEPAPCHFKYCFLRNHGLQWESQCVLETSTVTAKFIMADFLNTAC